MSQETKVPIEFPFDDEHADIVLQSSDAANFRVYKAVLALVSPVFSNMFQLPQPPESSPVIPVDDTAKDLHRFLTWCDPRCAPSCKLEDLVVVLRLADKYDAAVIMKRIGKLLVQLPDIAQKEPLRLFAIAVRYQLVELAQLAAKKALSFTMNEIISKPIPEFNLITASSLQSLMVYHLQCRTAVSAGVFGESGWLPSNHGFDGATCCYRQYWGADRKGWWAAYMICAAGVLAERPYPSSFDIVTNPNVTRAGFQCSVCRDRFLPLLKEFQSGCFMDQLTKVISTVELKLEF